MGRSVELWDNLLVYYISQKFSPKTRAEWNLQRGSFQICPTYKELNEFMIFRIRGLIDCSKPTGRSLLRVVPSRVDPFILSRPQNALNAPAITPCINVRLFSNDRSISDTKRCVSSSSVIIACVPGIILANASPKADALIASAHIRLASNTVSYKWDKGVHSKTCQCLSKYERGCKNTDGNRRRSVGAE